jgi:hypothetical protein
MARLAQQQGAISVYTQAVISSLDPTPLARISAPDGTSTANLTLLHIITRLEELHGRLPAAVLTLEPNKLDMPFTHGMSIHDHLTMHRTAHSVAASNGQPISGHQNSPIYMKAYANPPFHLALQMYDRVHVTLQKRSFNSLATEAEQALVAMHVEPDTATHGYGIAAVSAEDTHTLVARLVAEALAAQRVAPGQRETTTTPAATTTTKAPKAPRQSAYCWTHGWTFHSSL